MDCRACVKSRAGTLPKRLCELVGFAGAGASVPPPFAFGDAVGDTVGGIGVASFISVA